MYATWEDVTIAKSDKTIVIEGNHYFPLDSVMKEYLRPSDHTTTCIWKGVAHYYDVVVPGKEPNNNAAWYYPQPKEGSIERAGQDFTSYVAFWKGVQVT
jgi:uncharacterized protein (DUF427 family)